MVETNSNVDMILSDALREARGKLARQHEFAVAVEAFQQKLLQDLAQTNVGAQSLIKKLGDSLDAMVQSSLYILNSGVSSLKTDVGKLSQVDIPFVILNRNIGSNIHVAHTRDSRECNTH